jgi:hypothetical protein
MLPKLSLDVRCIATQSACSRRTLVHPHRHGPPPPTPPHHSRCARGEGSR